MDRATREIWGAARPKEPPFDTACIAPWVALEFDPQGWVFACCTSGLYPLGRIGEQRLSELWDGPRARVLKDALRRWDMSVACQPCRFHLEYGRMDPAAAVYDQYPLDGPDVAGPHMMLFALSNRCNLGCVMCSPALSSTLQAEAGLPPSERPYDDQFFEDLEPMLSVLGVAKFLGGEPFLSPEHRRVWTMLDQLDSPPKLSVTTNGTIWTDTVEWLMDRFEVDISVSVDAATPETYAAVRRGGDLNVVHRNMDRFAQRCRDSGTNLHVSYCLMPQNAHELGRFLVWAEQYTIGAPAYVNLVSDEGLALHDLSTPELESIRARWAEDDDAISTDLERNLATWRTQLTQLDAVLSSRHDGVVPVSTRAHRASPSALAPVVTAAEASDTHLAEERDRMSAWCEGGQVAIVRCDLGGTVTAVDAEHARLGIDEPRLVGAPISSLLGTIEHADGRECYLLDHDENDDRVTRTLVLAAVPPARGVEGSVVRVVQIRDNHSFAYLVAEDRTYDRDGRGAGVAVAAPDRR